MFNKVLVPTDFSAEATQALVVGAHWARQAGAPLGILHVDEDFESGLHSSEAVTTFLATVERRRQDLLDAAQFRASQVAPLVDVFRRRGAAAAEIGACASENGFDLLVMASHNRTGLRRLAGSTAYRVLRRLPIATLILNEISLGRISDPARVRRILFPTDFSDASVQGLRRAVELARLFGASLEVLHVLQLPTLMPSVPGEPALVLPHEFRTSREQLFRNKLDELVATVEGVETSYRVTIGPSVGTAIVEFAERYDFDVICIPAQGHGALHNVFFGSVAQSTVEAASAPVLVLPPRP